jgi:hypothetical protein
MALLRVDGRLIDEHDRNVVANRVHSATFSALERVVFLGQRCLADGANEYFKKRFIDHFGNSTPMRNSATKRAVYCAGESWVGTEASWRIRIVAVKMNPALNLQARTHGGQNFGW